MNPKTHTTSRSIRRALLTVGLATCAFGTAIADNIRVTQNHMTYNGVRYFRGNATSHVMGNWGEKREPVTGQNYLDSNTSNVRQHVTSFTRPVPFTYAFERNMSANVKGSLSLAFLGIPLSISGDDLYEKFRSGEYKFVHVGIKHTNDDFRRRLNADADFISRFRDRNDNRIVTSVIIVMKGTEAGRLTLSHDGKLVMLAPTGGSSDDTGKGKGTGKATEKPKGKPALTQGKLNLKGIKGTKGTTKGSGTGGTKGKGAGFLTVDPTVTSTSSEEYTIDKRQVFAYLLSKPDWDANRQNRRTKILSLRVDQHGP